MEVYLPEVLAAGLWDAAKKEGVTPGKYLLMLLTTPIDQIGGTRQLACPLCGRAWVAHEEMCPRHEFMPAWAQWEVDVRFTRRVPAVPGPDEDDTVVPDTRRNGQTNEYV